MSEPVFVAFATQKGGAGKSTLTALTASYLYYLEGVDVLVIDCDDRQHSQRIIGKTTLPLPEKILISKGCVKTSTRNLKKRHTRLYSPIQPKRRKSLLTELKKAQTPMWCFLTSQEL